MERHLIRPGYVGNVVIQWSCASLMRILYCCRKYSTAKRNLIIVSACIVYLFFTGLQLSKTFSKKEKHLGHPQHRTGRGALFKPYNDFLEAIGRPTTKNDSQIQMPTRFSVVYITLKTKRHKPAIIRGTVRPKLRRKKPRRDMYRDINAQDSALDIDIRRQKRKNANYTSWDQVEHIGRSHSTHDQQAFGHNDRTVSSIRIYSERAPPWFSKNDITAMRSLADGRLAHIAKFMPKGSPSVFALEGMVNVVNSLHEDTGPNGGLCSEGCAMAKRPVDMSEVFAFHLDRILGLNRSLPIVSRRLHTPEEEQLCPVALWDPSLSPVTHGASGLTWGSYQTSLKHNCWHRGTTPRPDWGCTSIHHYEWSKLALFDFLLQVYERLDKNCCGFKPRPEDQCVEDGHHGECGDSVELAHVVHHKYNPRHLVFVNNRGFFDRDEDNLNFKLLEGIRELPDQPVSVLKSQRLREKLLQSLFLDQQYWESQGGRQGIERLIDVIERRAKVLLRYINAHGIKVIAMNT